MPWNVVYTIKTRLTAYLRIMEEMRFWNNLHQVKNFEKPNNLKAVGYVNQTGLNNIAKIELCDLWLRETDLSLNILLYVRTVDFKYI